MKEKEEVIIKELVNMVTLDSSKISFIVGKWKAIINPTKRFDYLVDYLRHHNDKYTYREYILAASLLIDKLTLVPNLDDLYGKTLKIYERSISARMQVHKLIKEAEQGINNLCNEIYLEPLGEPMNTLPNPPKQLLHKYVTQNIATVTLVNGVDVKDLTEADFFQKIKVFQEELTELSKLPNSKYVAKRVSNLSNDLDSLVKLMDASLTVK